MKIAICDDSQLDRENLKKNLYLLEQELDIEFDIMEFSSPSELYETCQSIVSLNIIFLDIYIGDILGTEVARKLRDMGYNGSLIFCTTSEAHALEGFRVKADGYLVKPYSYDEFKDSLSRLMTLFQNEQKKIKFVSERIEYDISLSDIYLIETDNKGCLVYTKNGTLSTWKHLKDFIQEINSASFYQLGRFCLINLDYVERVKEDWLLMKNEKKLYFPKRKALEIKQYINNYIWSKMRS